MQSIAHRLGYDSRERPRAERIIARMFTEDGGFPTVDPPQQDNAPPPIFAFRTLIDTFVEDATRRKTLHDAGKKFGPVTGFPELDDRLGGCLESGLHIIHGSPGSAKTAFALQVGAQCGCPCLFVSAEMRVLELFRRHSARINETFLNKYKRGQISPNVVRAEAVKAATAAPDLVLLDATERAALPRHIVATAEQTREIAKENGSDSPHLLIIVDSVHSWADEALPGVPEYDRLNDGIAQLRKIAKILDCTVIGVAERNRASIKAKEQGAGQNSSAGSRKFEYAGESVIGLDSDGEEYDTGRGTSREHPVTAREVTATISKNRHGTMGKPITFEFCGAFQEFSMARKGSF